MVSGYQFADYFTSYEKTIYRTVEGQSASATRKLTDNVKQHEILEKMLERSKPVAPEENSRGKLRFLLFTPFRYPPLNDGGRFHRITEQSVFYGAEALQTSLAERAYRRFCAMQNTTAYLKESQIQETSFQVCVQSAKAILLTEEPFRVNAAQINDPTSHRYSQIIGTEMREAGAELFTYFSARNPQGINVGLFTPEAFSLNQPVKSSEIHWNLFVTPDKIEFWRCGIAAPEVYAFQMNADGEFTVCK
jgi:hypothetical protein